MKNEALQRMLADWPSQLAAISVQNAQEFEHYYGVFLPTLRTRTTLAQISIASLRVPGDFFDEYGTRLPVPSDRLDHRSLFGDREFQNAVVEKLWVEEDMLRAYRGLEPKMEQLLATLNSEIARRGD